MVRFGQRLKDERVKRKLTLDEISVATKIKRNFLDAIEREAYNELPSPAYAKGFVQNYADFLGLPKIQSAALFKRDFDEKRAIKVLPEGMTKSSDFPIRRLNLRKSIFGILFFLVIIVFLLFQSRDIFLAPSISIKSPKGGSIVSRDIDIIGKTDSNAVVTVNNDPVFVQNNGEFDKKITLFPGNAIIIIKSKNRLGRESIENLSLTVK